MDERKEDEENKVFKWFVYIIECRDKSFYCGVTTDLKRRMRQHNGKLKGGSRYCKGRRPLKLVYKEEALDSGAALRRENEIRKLSRTEKEVLVYGKQTNRL